MAEDTECNGIIVGPAQGEWSPLRAIVRSVGEAIDKATLPEHCFADQMDAKDAEQPAEGINIDEADLSGDFGSKATLPESDTSQDAGFSAEGGGIKIDENGFPSTSGSLVMR